MADNDLSGKLAGLLTEIKEVMESRKERIEELRKEISDIEAQNAELEKTISDLLSGFDWFMINVVTHNSVFLDHV